MVRLDFLKRHEHEHEHEHQHQHQHDAEDTASSSRKLPPRLAHVFDPPRPIGPPQTYASLPAQPDRANLPAAPAFPARTQLGFWPPTTHKQEQKMDEYEAQVALALQASKREAKEAAARNKQKADRRRTVEEAELLRAQRVSLRATGSDVCRHADALSFKYWESDSLNYDDHVSDGFYDLLGEFGEVAPKKTFPTLDALRRVTLRQDDHREVIVFDHDQDAKLCELDELAADAMAEAVSQGPKACVQALARVIVNHMGGPMRHTELSKRYQEFVKGLKLRHGSAVIPIGQLSVGLPRHRALLFKALADACELPCRLLRGRFYTGGSEEKAVVMVRSLDQEVIVNLLDEPGKLMPMMGSLRHLSAISTASSGLDLSVEELGSPNLIDLLGPSTSGLALEALSAAGPSTPLIAPRRHLQSPSLAQSRSVPSFQDSSGVDPLPIEAVQGGNPSLPSDMPPTGWLGGLGFNPLGSHAADAGPSMLSYPQLHGQAQGAAWVQFGSPNMAQPPGHMPLVLPQSQPAWGLQHQNQQHESQQLPPQSHAAGQQQQPQQQLPYQSSNRQQQQQQQLPYQSPGGMPPATPQQQPSQQLYPQHHQGQPPSHQASLDQPHPIPHLQQQPAQPQRLQAQQRALSHPGTLLQNPSSASSYPPQSLAVPAWTTPAVVSPSGGAIPGGSAATPQAPAWGPQESGPPLQWTRRDSTEPRMKGMLAGRAATFYVEEACPHNLVSAAFAAAHSMQPVPGANPAAPPLLAQVPMRLGGHRETITFTMAELTDCDVLLGAPWLEYLRTADTGVESSGRQRTSSLGESSSVSEHGSPPHPGPSSHRISIDEQGLSASHASISPPPAPARSISGGPTSRVPSAGASPKEGVPPVGPVETPMQMQMPPRRARALPSPFAPVDDHQGSLEPPMHAESAAAVGFNQPRVGNVSGARTGGAQGEWVAFPNGQLPPGGSEANGPGQAAGAGQHQAPVTAMVPPRRAPAIKSPFQSASQQAMRPMDGSRPSQPDAIARNTSPTSSQPLPIAPTPASARPTDASGRKATAAGMRTPSGNGPMLAQGPTRGGQAAAGPGDPFQWLSPFPPGGRPARPNVNLHTPPEPIPGNVQAGRTTAFGAMADSPDGSAPGPSGQEDLSQMRPLSPMRNAPPHANAAFSPFAALAQQRLVPAGPQAQAQGGVDSLADVEELPDGVTIRAEPMSPPIPHEVDEWEIPAEEIELGPRVGIGSFGEVYRGTWRLTDVAVKRFLEQDLKPENIEEFRAEVSIMKRLKHPNVILFMGACTLPPNLCIVTQFMPRGSLFRLLHRTPSVQLDDRRRLRLAADVCKGMHYLHSCKPPIVHRDLKSPNLLVDKDFTVKVCDFGLSRVRQSTWMSAKSQAGTPEWTAPEVLRSQQYNEKSDVYSFGVILWELITNQEPWQDKNAMQVVGAVGWGNARLPIPSDIAPELQELLEKCWDEPTQRPGFEGVLSVLRALVAQPNFVFQSSSEDDMGASQDLSRPVVGL